MSAGVGGLLALAASGPAPGLAWGITWVVAGVGFLGFVADEVRLRRFNARAWTTRHWENLREREYKRREGVFLTHSIARTDPPQDCRPELRTKQWWSVTVRLNQHRDGPLSEGKVREVEYAFPGDRFSEGSYVFGDKSRDGFPYTTEIYGPLMVIGRVQFTNPLKRPLMVETYVALPSDH